MNVNALAGARPMQARPCDPDAELVAAARTNPREFLALYDRYFDRVLGYVRLRIRDPATCEDVTSRVFTTALEQIGRLRETGASAGGCSRSPATRCATRSVSARLTRWTGTGRPRSRRPRSVCSSSSEPGSSTR